MLPSFETRRLLVRPRTLADLEACLSMDRDPLVTQYIRGPWSDPEAHRSFVVDRITRSYPDGLGYWSVINQSPSGGFLGWILLLPYDDMEGEVEIGWRFIRSSWGHGYASEAATVVLEHAFRAVGLPAIVADIDPSNGASMRVAEKIGMQDVGDRIIKGMRFRSYQLNRSQFDESRRVGAAATRPVA